MTKVVATVETSIIEEPQYQTYVSTDEMWAAIPYGNQYIVLNNGFQVHLARNLTTAKTFISKQMRKLKK